MNRHGPAWIKRVSAIEVRLWWPFDEVLLEEFKALIPFQQRRWFRDGSEMYWVVTGEFSCAQAERWFDRHFADPFDNDPFKSGESSRRSSGKSSNGSRPNSPPPNSGSDWDVLYLRSGAPAGLVDVAYRWWAKEAHPDRGGSTQRMQEINTAYDRLRKVTR